MSRSLDMSIFFFSSDGTTSSNDKYDLVLECSRYADRHGFAAVWTPERHFNRFGGLYPNPAVLGAAIAAQTSRIGIRAGSVVLPLHSPIRVAEEWSVVDNISRGRVAIAFASGWHKTDFVLQPAAYADRREHMERSIDLVLRLWRGERVTFTQPDNGSAEIAIYPRPLQSELQFWLTASSPPTWIRAGRLGANVLCLLGTSMERLAQLIRDYRAARQEHGHDPAAGQVTVMLHTFIDEDLEGARTKVREPLLRYLKDFVEHAEMVRNVAAAREDELLELAFEKRFALTSLIGPKAKCRVLLDKLYAVGVSEIACLVDFGLPKSDVLASMEGLEELRKTYLN